MHAFIWRTASDFAANFQSSRSKFICPAAVQRPLSVLASFQYGPGCARVQAWLFFDIPVSV